MTSALHNHSLILAREGLAAARIILANEASASERQAASELAEHLTVITGALWPIAELGDGPLPEDGPWLAVGPGAACRLGVAPERLAELGADGFVILRHGQDLILSGGPAAPRGTLYAVFSFLEEDLGCRWWTPTVSSLPTATTLRVSPRERRELPAFAYREVLYQNAWDAAWLNRNRLNAWHILGEERGGYIRYQGFVHTFGQLVPTDPWLARQPSWFAWDGARRHAEQLCLTDPGLVAFVAEQVRGWLLKAPAADIVSISQNDNKSYCRCPGCQASDLAHGGPAGTLIVFLNTIAGQLAADFPKVAFDTLAYQYTRRPGKVRPAANVIVRLCSFECDFLHPFDHPNNASWLADLRGWQALGARLFVWDYAVNYAHFVQPYPNWFTLGDNLRLLQSHGVEGIFSQANNSSLGGEMAELRAWMLTKLQWQPSRDNRALVREFLHGYYGAAGQAMEAYLQRLHQAALAVPFYPGGADVQATILRAGLPPAAKEGLYLDLNSPTDAPFLAPAVIFDCFAHLQHALAAAHCPATRLRVAQASLPLRYVTLLRWVELRAAAATLGRPWPQASTWAAALAEFRELHDQAGIRLLGEAWSNRHLAWLSEQAPPAAS